MPGTARRRASAHEWARQQAIEDAKHRANFKKPGPKPGSRRAPRVPPWNPKKDQPARFLVSRKIVREWFPDDRHWWHARYFFNIVRWRKVTWRANGEGFVQLCARLMAKVTPSPVLQAVKNVLLERGVVQKDDIVDRGKSMGWKIAAEYLNDIDTVTCELDELNRNIHRAHAKVDRKLTPTCRWLKEKFALFEFDSNRERALNIISKLKPRSRKKKTSLKEHRRDRRENYERFACGDTWFTVDAYGRVATNLTSLESALIPCLRVKTDKGLQHLVELDVANCQPLLLCVMARQFDGSSWKVKNRVLRSKFSDEDDPYRQCNQRLSASANKPTHTTTRINGNYLYRSPSYDGDLGNAEPGYAGDGYDASFSAAEEGVFYETMMAPEELAKGKPARNRLKKRFYRVLFGENRSKSIYRNETKRRFREKHPELAEFLRTLKARNYKHSSHLLQNFEATVFIHRICGRIRKEMPNAVIFTKHDGVLTTPDREAAVKAIMKDEFAKLGVNVKIERKDHR
jgi:hypothetical protein